MPFIDRCRGCPYHGRAIGPRGDPTSRIVLVGEAPGAQEIIEGEPFVGDAGGVLRAALAEAHIDEASIFITNSVACRPLNPAKPIRTPTPAAIDACRGRLAHDIELNPGAVLVALGAIAVQALTGQRGFPVRSEHGRVLASKWGRVVATVHPASGLHRPADRATLFAKLVDDFKDARRLAGLGEDAVEMRAPNVSNFRLRFPLSEVMFWAARYAYADDAEVEAIGDRARERGWYTRDEFLTVARWKSPRSRRRCEENDEAHVKAATQLALSTPDERQRIEALTQLHGVDYPTASVLLHLAHRDPYPIIDFRALWSLGVESPPAAYSFPFWWAYTQACRSLAMDAGVRMRMLDRALWQFCKERRPSTGTPAAEPGDAPKTPPSGEAGTSKSAEMRRMFAEGSTIVEVAKALNVDYSFAYGVRKRWLALRQYLDTNQQADRGRVPRRSRGSKDDTYGRPIPSASRGEPMDSEFPTDVYVLLVEAAIEGRTIYYSALPNGRGVGDRLRRIADYERAHKRPPLTAIVVLKQTGRPGAGFGPTMAEIGYARQEEPEAALWKRALADVFRYWRP